MKLFIKYIKNFNTISVILSNKKITRTEKDLDTAILFHDKEIVGFNIFNFKSNKVFSLEDKSLKRKVRPILKKYLGDFKLERQFIIAKITECEKIPETHLSKCKVNIGKKEVQIICGAKNARKNIYTTLATIDSWMPDGTQIKPGKLKGFDSFGMLCSARELGINNEKYNNEGIMEWEVDDSYIGKSIWEVLNEK
ncbi:YtpR family tRNA-binding protein [Spiroplasma endosymbiont of Dioctria linearis]|uniref:YtpR family tRNA-binding protein n=1 Tax=Spiroplasma endosymbiont of Dioctria linearis TaxID=3066290 RepID=UPI00313EA98D